MEIITASPAVADFTALSEHRAQTPSTFFDGEPVLHFHSENAELRAKAADLAGKEGYKNFLGGSNDEGNVNVPVSVFVASDFLTIFSPALNHGIKIPYPSIFVHAPDGNAVMLQILHSDGNAEDADGEDGDLGYVELRVAPAATERTVTTEDQANGVGAGSRQADAVMAMYQAVSACQDLNPDEDDEEGFDGDVDGGFDETAPGATGWITSENMADLMDADGNLVMPGGGGPLPVIGGEVDGVQGEPLGELGEGGERRRAAEDDTVEGDEGTKWQRTD